MNSQSNVNSVLSTELPHKSPHIVATFIHNNFESPNITKTFAPLKCRRYKAQLIWYYIFYKILKLITLFGKNVYKYYQTIKLNSQTDTISIFKYATKFTLLI
jgi:hypothetical protein